uniref:S-acyl fatty acid synthase thioesterase, medium chain n=1 Tax=Sus scrofa TaxID=9823 RepID=A0A8D1LBF1_PIG
MDTWILGVKFPKTALYADAKSFVNCLYRNPGALFRLVFFPWSGGGSTFFLIPAFPVVRDINSLPQSQVHSIRLAGRENWSEEPFPRDIYQIVDEVVHTLLPIIRGENFTFFGHSMGCYIAFLTALHLKEKYMLEPVHLFMSSSSAPHVSNFIFLPEDAQLTDEQIICGLRETGGIPKELIADKEFLTKHIPKVISDMRLISDYIFDLPPKALLSCDLTCFIGSEDVITDAEAWKDVTSGSFDIHVLPGDHFYILEPSNEDFIKNYITKTLELSMWS